MFQVKNRLLLTAFSLLDYCASNLGEIKNPPFFEKPTEQAPNYAI
jgi:hypothetical protein